jgi:Ricin-type beta-trefoil lectin domain/Dual-action HEIGH metallo-peptidase
MHKRSGLYVSSIVGLLGALAGGGGCASVEDEPHRLTFEELRASAYEEEPGWYVIEGDLKLDEASLRRYYDTVLVPEMERARLEREGLSVAQSNLAVNQKLGIIPGRWEDQTICPPAPPCTPFGCPPAPPCVTVPVWIPPVPGYVDDVLTSSETANLTYCISNAEGGNVLSAANKLRLVNAMQDAAQAWNSAASVRFTYRPDQDASCNAGNANVVFDVHANFANPSYIARAFFPSDARAQRNIQVHSGWLAALSPGELVSTMTHELGHVLGFRHEHIRTSQASADPSCGESPGSYRALTSYDGGSIMHYDFCNGATSTALTTLSQRDLDGARALYGSGTIPVRSFVGLASKCLDVQWGSSASGTPLHLWDCNGTAAQRWSLEPTSEVKALGKCLDLSNNNTSDGTQIQIWDCNGTTAQRWFLWDGTLRHHASSKCVEVTGGSSASGTLLRLATCNGSLGQRWIPN